MIYLDSASTAQLNSDTAEILKHYLNESWGNPSGAHSVARHSKNLLEESRESLARSLGVYPDKLIFTSGATEALNIAIQGYARKNPDCKIFYSAIEHAAVINTVKFLSESGMDVYEINVNEDGIFEEQFIENINRDDLVCIMPVNNETGVVNDVIELSKKIRDKGAKVLFDCVQSIYSFEPKELVEHSDFAVFSGHKLGSPQGVGVLIVSNRKSIIPLSFGGSQEWEIRPGTTPTYLIATFVDIFTNAIKKRVESIEHIVKCQQICESILQNETGEAEIHSSKVKRSPHITSFNSNHESQMLVAMADREDVCISRGSSCASGAVTPSHVLTAMGIEEKSALSTLRISFDSFTSFEDVELGTKILIECIAKLTNSKKVVIA